MRFRHVKILSKNIQISHYNFLNESTFLCNIVFDLIWILPWVSVRSRMRMAVKCVIRYAAVDGMAELALFSFMAARGRTASRRRRSEPCCAYLNLSPLRHTRNSGCVTLHWTTSVVQNAIQEHKVHDISLCYHLHNRCWYSLNLIDYTGIFCVHIYKI